MYISFKTHLHNPDKPEGMPDEWIWGTVVPSETNEAPDQSGEWVTLTKEQFDAYKVLHRASYQAYIDAIEAEENAVKEMLRVNQEKIDFGRKLMLNFKNMNIEQGINPVQAIWLHAKTRKLQVQIPQQAFGAAIDCEVDILNMALSGDLEAGCIALQFAIPDDMTEAYHWLNQDRINFLVTEIKAYLGWP